MANYLIVNDIHLSDRAPSSCTDSYLSDLFTLLEQTVTLAHDHDCAAVIWAGDVFHHKTPSRTSHSTVMGAMHIAESYPCPLWIVPGNHDITNDRLDSIDQTQPLGVLFASGAAHLLNGWMPREDPDAETHPVYGVPWLQHFDDDTVMEALACYRAGLVDEDDQILTHPTLVVTHAPLYPPGKELKFEHYDAFEWAVAMAYHGTVHYGHVHEPHGVYTVGRVQFSNCGALSRGSLHEHNLTREVQVALWDSDTGEIRHLTVPHRPAAEVFRLKDVAEVRTAKIELDTFLESVGTTRLSITSTESVVEHIRSLGLEPKLEQVLHELLGVQR